MKKQFIIKRSVGTHFYVLDTKGVFRHLYDQELINDYAKKFRSRKAAEKVSVEGIDTVESI